MAVIEGVGDHGCEYMTGGTVVVLGKTGRNFGAGMSGGQAFVLAEDETFIKNKCNFEIVTAEKVTTDEDKALLRSLIEKHVLYTNSPKGKRILTDFDAYVTQFVKVIAPEYKLVLEKKAAAAVIN